MGCDNSKTVRVQPMGSPVKIREHTAELDQQTADSKARRSGKGQREKDGKGRRGKSGKRRQAEVRDGMGSCDSLEDDRSLDSERGNSATSKKSEDSGLGEEYSHVITEFSEEDKIRQVENDFVARDDLDLGITGVSCPTRLSAKDKVRLEESNILQSLREEGLISKHKAEAAGGVCFEIVEATVDERPRLPLRLEKLEKKSKKVLTEDEINAKLERAERRRKKREQERLEKLRDLDHTDTLAALETFEQYQRCKEDHIVQKMDLVSDNRERRISEMKQKMEKRRQHAEEVRMRKKLAQENAAFEGEDPAKNTPDGTAQEF